MSNDQELVDLEALNRQKLTASEFLDLIKVIKMLYGRNIAEMLFNKNYKKFILNESINNKNGGSSG